MEQIASKENFNEYKRLLFNGNKWEERANAALKLGHLKDDTGVDLLIKALKNEKDHAVLDRIIEALGNLKNTEATLPIINFLKQELSKVNQNKTRLFLIIESLMKIGDKRALTHLGILLSSCEEDIRKRTEEAFNCIDPTWKENVIKM
jgi:HEAT repeat protein